MANQKKMTVIGAGVWGTALGSLVERNYPDSVTLWSRRSETALVDVVQDVEFVLSAVSMKGVLPTIEKLKGHLPKSTILITATKGLDPDTMHTPSQLWQEAFPDNPVVVLSGPNLSKEIMRELPAATTVSSGDEVAAEKVQAIFSSDTFRVYVNPDPLGTELGGTLKNIMAIAAGVCDGMQLGTNAKAGLLTRALPEMIRMGAFFGAQTETFFGLSGMGDLIATCDSPLSRNYQVGFGLAQGKTIEQILADLEGTAEGLNTTNVVAAIAKKESIPMPITRQVFLLTKGKTTPMESVQNLMDRDLKWEFEDLDFSS